MSDVDCIVKTRAGAHAAAQSMDLWAGQLGMHFRGTTTDGGTYLSRFHGPSDEAEKFKSNIENLLGVEGITIVEDRTPG